MKVYGVTGWKNTGKTGLVTRLVSHFTARGLQVSTIKHAHHSFDVDQPGRDSFRHREAGASEVIVASSERVAIMSELRDAPEPGLDELLRRLTAVDLVIVEGYKAAPHPKIETWRSVAAHPTLIADSNPSIRAIASDTPLDNPPHPVLDLDDTAGIAAFIERETGL